jgi:hypothetical protein
MCEYKNIVKQKKKVRYLMKKTLKIVGITLGVIAMIVILFFEVAAFDGYIDSKVDRVQAAIQEQKTISKDSLVKAALPLFFADSSFDMEDAKMPKEFPAYTNPTTDSGISMNIGDFSDYFKKVFEKTPADQIIITAVQTDDPKILRWHIKVHEREK